MADPARPLVRQGQRRMSAAQTPGWQPKRAWGAACQLIQPLECCGDAMVRNEEEEHTMCKSGGLSPEATNIKFKKECAKAFPFPRDYKMHCHWSHCGKKKRMVHSALAAPCSRSHLWTVGPSMGVWNGARSQIPPRGSAPYCLGKGLWRLPFARWCLGFINTAFFLWRASSRGK